MRMENPIPAIIAALGAALVKIGAAVGTTIALDAAFTWLGDEFGEDGPSDGDLAPVGPLARRYHLNALKQWETRAGDLSPGNRQAALLAVRRSQQLMLSFEPGPSNLEVMGIWWALGRVFAEAEGNPATELAARMEARRHIKEASGPPPWLVWGLVGVAAVVVLTVMR